MSVAETTQVRSLGRYNLIASLGQGGMANVYLAVAAGFASFNKLLVLKTLRQDATPDFVHMFLDEARLSARFNHPNIVQAYEVGESNGTFFIALEYLEGQSLRAVQRKLGIAFPLEDELRAIAETARGLHHAHELKDFAGDSLHVVHRDVSPQNVFLTYDGQVKLLDFGIAKAIDSEHPTQVGLIKGKLDYIAPEQVRGESVDRRADIFSLGAMTWEAVTRQRFSGGHKVSDVAKLHKRLTGGERDVREVQPEVPEQLANVIRRAVSVDPAHRFDTAASFAVEIERFLDSMNLRPSAQTLCEHLALSFRAERVKIAAVIEEQLRRLSQDGGKDLSMVALDRSDTTVSNSGLVSSYRSDATGLSRTSLVVTSQSPSPPPHWTRSPLAKLGVVGAALGLAAALALSNPQPKPRSKGAALPTGPGASTSAATATRTGKPASADSEPAHAVKNSTVALAVQVSPSGARVELDGAILPTLPFQAELARDGMVHRIEASAPGYRSQKFAIPFDRDRELLIVLERAEVTSTRTVSRRTRAERRREERGAEGQREAAPSALAAARPASVEPGAAIVSKHRSGLRVDKTNPYAD